MDTLAGRFLIDEERASIRTVTIREINGKDERTAKALAKQRNSDEYEEMVRLSITHVDDQPVEQPYDEYDEWNVKTRLWVRRAFATINGVDLDKIDPFVKGAEIAPLKQLRTTTPAIGLATSG